MVTGIDSFKEWFKGSEEQYAIIGGTACDILMTEDGLDFRATNDIDLVLIIEAVDAYFGKKFWEYVKSYLQIIVSAVVCAANIAENTLLVPIIGGVGAAISTGLSYIVFFAMRTILSNKYFPMKWGMGKFSLITLLFLAYAWYNTFHSFGMVTVLGYVTIFAIMVFNYRDVIRDGFRLLKKRFS